MNRGLFCTLVLVFCIALVVSMASCESRSGRRAVTTNDTVLSNQVTVKVVTTKLIRQTYISGTITKTFRTKKLLDSTIYFWQTSMPYEVGDTINVPLLSLKQ
jgi:hypothetical protein